MPIDPARTLLADLRRTWPQLAVSDLLAKAAAFLILTPALALLLRVFVSSGDDWVLSDQEILYFVLSPSGIVLLVLASVVWIALGFAEQAGLMTIGFGALEARRVTYLQALSHVLRQAVPIAKLTLRIVVRVLLLAAPFLAAAGGLYFWLLSEHDINYYMAERPPEFWIAAVSVGAVLVPLAVLLLRLCVRWLLALPLLLLGRPGDPLQASAEATRGHGRLILAWLACWALGTLALSGLVSALAAALSRWILPTDSSTLTVAAACIGTSLLLASIGHMLVSLLSSALYALLVVRLSERLGARGRLDLPGLAEPGSLGARASFQVPARGLLLGVFVSAALVGLSTLWVLGSNPGPDDAVVIAHRGGALAAPENTMAAIEAGMADGAEWIEIDVQESADGVVVIAHDKDYMRISGIPTCIWEGAYAELRTIDIGSWFGPAYADQRPPTLADVLLACKGRAGVVIELKYYGHDERLEERVVEIVEETDMVADVMIMSLERKGLFVARDLRPSWRYGLLSAVSVGDLSRIDVDFLAVNAGGVTQGMIRRAHARGRDVYVWTVDSPAQMSALLSMGVDGLITDDPRTARSVLAQRAEMNPVERMIVAFGASFGLVEGAGESSDADDA